MDAQAARLQKLEREYAVAVLETLSSEGRAPKAVDQAVATLARDYAHLPIGDCESCGARAPLTGGDGSERGASVCAWGCGDAATTTTAERQPVVSASAPDRLFIDANRDPAAFSILKRWAIEIIRMEQRRQSGVRTRAQVDRDIAKLVRSQFHGSGRLQSGMPSMKEWSAMVNRLCAERTDDGSEHELHYGGDGYHEASLFVRAQQRRNAAGATDPTEPDE